MWLKALALILCFVFLPIQAETRLIMVEEAVLHVVYALER